MQKKRRANVNDPKLPRKRRLLRRLDDGNAETHNFPSTAKDHYRQIYFQTLDAAINCIKDIFDQPDFRKYIVLQEMVRKIFKDQPLENELRLKKFFVSYLLKLSQALDYSRKVAMSEIIKAAKILLVIPTTNAISERFFSAMKRVKAFLRSTTTDSRMKHLIVLHVQKERVDNISLIDVANEFVKKTASRRANLWTIFKQRLE